MTEAAKHGPVELEVKILQLEIRCGELGYTCLLEKDSYLTTVNDPQNRLLDNLTKAYCRYLKAVQELDGQPAASSTQVTFRKLLDNPDEQILGAVQMASNDVAQDIMTHTDVVKNFLEPSNDWTSVGELGDQGSSATIEQIIQLTEKTLMAVKGKKLQEQVFALRKATVIL